MCNNCLYGWYSKGGEFMLEPMADAHIKLENVSYLYDNEISGGVQKINFEIRPGECVLLCGKVDVENNGYQTDKWFDS